MLNKIRIGKVDDSIIQMLQKCSHKKIDKHASIQPTKLFPYKKDVELINRKHLLKLKNNIITHDIKTKVEHITDDWNQNEINYLMMQMDNSYPYKDKLEISIGAQVMLNVNLKNLVRKYFLSNKKKAIVTIYKKR